MRVISFKAIILGFLTDIIGSLLGGIIVGMIWIGYELALGMKMKDFNDPVLVQQAMNANVLLMVFSCVLGLLFTALGGAVTAWFAPAPYRFTNVTVLGLFEIVLGAFFVSKMALWYDVATGLLTLPAVIFGAYLVKLVKADLKTAAEK